MAARHAAAAAAAAATALSCLLLLPASTLGQMETPLKGQGSPGMNTTEVFLSVYLDRLLEGEVEVGRQAATSSNALAHAGRACHRPAWLLTCQFICCVAPLQWMTPRGIASPLYFTFIW